MHPMLGSPSDQSPQGKSFESFEGYEPADPSNELNAAQDQASEQAKKTRILEIVRKYGYSKPRLKMTLTHKYGYSAEEADAAIKYVERLGLTGTPKVEATQLTALQITQGDNFNDAKKNLKMLNALPGREFEIIGEAGPLTVLSRKHGLGQWYILVTQVEAGGLKSAKTLKAVTEIKGFMAVLKFPNVDEVFSVYTAEDVRGKGLGKKLYELAHAGAKKGLQSSEDLGTMSLGVWLSLYKANEKIVLVLKGKKLPRKDIKINGQQITYKGQDLIGPDTPNFNFFWK